MQLAQLNIADALAPTDAPEMSGFTNRVDAINALADRATGFVWRLVDDGPEDGALALRMEGEGPATLVNMSVWTDLHSLFHFVYKTAHTKVMMGKRDWFAPIPRFGQTSCCRSRAKPRCNWPNSISRMCKAKPSLRHSRKRTVPNGH